MKQEERNVRQSTKERKRKEERGKERRVRQNQQKREGNKEGGMDGRTDRWRGVKKTEEETTEDPYGFHPHPGVVSLLGATLSGDLQVILEALLKTILDVISL